MAMQTITITDADQNRDYTLEISFDLLPDEPEFGYHGGVEVAGVRCTEIITWCGDASVSAFPVHDERASLERRIGQWCLERYREEIEAAVMEELEPACC